MQTGLTRYAPMQPVPGTKVTATNTKPMFPTSSVRMATTRLPIPSQATTLTATQTFSTKMIENTVRYLKDGLAHAAVLCSRYQPNSPHCARTE